MPSADLLSVLLPRRRSGRRTKLFLLLAVLLVAILAVFAADNGSLRVGGGTRGDGLSGPPAPLLVAASPPEPVPAEPALSDVERVMVCDGRLADCLLGLAREAGLGLLLGPGIDGSVEARFLDGQPWPARLDALARVHRLGYRVDEQLIEVERTIVPGTPGGDAAAGAACGAGEDRAANQALVAEVIRPLHARASDLIDVLARSGRAVGVDVAAEVTSNSIVAAGDENGVALIEALTERLDRPRHRFVLEAEIVELSRTARNELGVQWSLDGTVGGEVDFPAADAQGEGAGILVATDGAHDLRARIGALAADGRVRVVSRPRVVVLEGRAASIESVRILRVRFPDRTAVVGDVDDGVAIGSGRAVEEIPVGVTLEVEPSMQGGGRIVLRIRAKSSTLGPPQPPDGIPEELSREIDAEVSVADGETAVLGGLLREGTSRSGAGVPGLRSVPVLGLLFGRREREREDEELVVLVTPRLLSP